MFQGSGFGDLECEVEGDLERLSLACENCPALRTRVGFRVWGLEPELWNVGPGAWGAGCTVLGTRKLLRIDEKQFRGGLVFKARKFLYHSTPGREK